MMKKQSCVIFLWLLLSAAAIPVAATQIPFGSDHTIGSYSGHSYTADLDGDGDMDVVVYFGWWESDGSEPPAWTWHAFTEWGPTWYPPVDIDGDGDLDLISSTYAGEAGAYDLVYRENDGTPADGGWTERLIHAYEGVTGDWKPAAADIDDDGDMDVIANHGGEVTWFHNDGTPGNGAWTDSPIDSSASGWSVATGDLDGDGDIDVLANATNYLYWYENDGASLLAWTQRSIYHDVANQVTFIYTTDFDRDGDLDVLSADDPPYWYENDGTPADGGWTRYRIGSGSMNVFPKDMDGDGDPDVVHGGDDSGWFENTIPSLYADWNDWAIGVGDDAYWASGADIDGDGDMDVVCDQTGGDLVWYENETIHRSAVFPEESVISTEVGGAPHLVFAADIDGDGDLDAMSGSSYDNIAWYPNTDGAGTFGSQQVVSSNLDILGAIEAADIDGDGDLDILYLANWSDFELGWYENSSGDGSTWIVHDIDTNGGGQAARTTDLDADGDLDILTGQANAEWYENTMGDGSAWATRVISAFPSDCRPYEADLDADGDLDVLSASYGNDRVYWHENTAGDASAWTDHTVATGLPEPVQTDAKDIDGDGDMDFFVASEGNGAIYWYENTAGDGSAWTQHTVTTSVPAVEWIHAGDIDEDGDVDLFSSSYEGSPLVAWCENSAGDGSAWLFHEINPNGTRTVAHRVFAADLDGDGDLDVLYPVAMFDSQDDRVSWHENRGGQFALPTTDSAPPEISESVADDVLTITATHNGRSGDTDLELVTLELLFEETPGDPLSSAEANDLIENLYIYVDEGSGQFESEADTLVATLGTLALSTGVQTISFTDGDPNVQVAHGTLRNLFVVVEMAPGAATQSPGAFHLTHLTESSSSGEDRNNDIPLTLEFGWNVSSGPITPGPRVISVLPQDNALGVPVGTNVYVIFSEPVNPATVNPDTFRLLDIGGTPVAADVSLDAAGLQATLDPTSQLALDTIYTVEVNSGVEDLTGVGAIPFISYFRTEMSSSGTPLVSVSDEAAPPSNPLPGKGSSKADATPQRSGWSVARAGDLNSDGFDDIIAGAPGLSRQLQETDVCGIGEINECQPCIDDTDCGGVTGACKLNPEEVACIRPEVGAVSVYLGSATDTELESYDILFRGESSHDRVGAALAGDFDFNSDGIPDLLIGAEQYNRSGADDPVAGCLADAPCGSGKVYLIYFDPADYDSDAFPEIVDLGRVGNPSHPDGDIQGVVFTGASLGDIAGYALAAGGHLDSAGYEDIVIGAPGADGGAGTAYVIFGDPSLSGALSLVGVGTTIDGRAYLGSAGESLGHALALPGDIVGSSGGDLAIGAPSAGAGAVYLVPGGSLTPGSPVSASSITTRVNGDQTGEQLGHSLAGGGDNRRDGVSDLLIGAPGYGSAAGRVIQTSARFETAIAASAVGDTINGIIWEGAQAGDRLGCAVAGVGDVTGNNWPDILLAAAHSDPLSAPDAGAVYMIEGETESSLLGGVKSVDLVGPTVAGMRLIGVESGEHAGHSVAGAGDLNADGVNDFVAGAPDKTYDSQAGAGTVYLVTESVPDPPGSCDEHGCTVADLRNGAQIAVPPGSLEGTANLAVTGLLEEPTLESVGMSLPSGWMLAGAADYDDEGQGFPGTDPTAHVPTSEWAEQQVVDLTAETVFYFDEELDWVSLGALGTIQENPHYPARKSAGMVIDPLHVYAVVLVDTDDDDMRDTLDCAPTDGSAFRAPTEMVGVGMSSATMLEWTSEARISGVGTVYDVLRGDLDELAILGSGPGESCIGSDLVEPSLTIDDSTGLGPGEGYYYLVRGSNNCGIGSYGEANPPVERTSSECP